MALGHGVKIVTDGIQYGFDSRNKSKSYTGRKNLAKTAAGARDWTLASLTGTGISLATVIPDERFTITCTGTGSFRWYFNVSNLRAMCPYVLSMKMRYNNNANSNFAFTDWCDQSIKYKAIHTGNGIYSITAEGPPRGSYDGTYRFMDFFMDAGCNIDVWDVQLEEGLLASKYERKLITAVGEQFRDWSGTTVPVSGSIDYDLEGNPVFDGTNDKITLGVMTDLQAGSRTNEAWVKSYNMSNWHGIFSCGTNFSNGFGLQMGPNEGIAAQGSGNYLRTSWIPDEDRYYHIVATHDHITNKNRLYVDGKLEADATYNINYQAGVSQEMGIFYSGSSSLFLNGEIAQARLYSKALTEQEVRNNYNATKAQFRVGLTQDNPAVSATQIKQLWPQAPSGIYYIQVRNDGPVIPVYCDMETDGGGWMLIVQNTNINGGTKLNQTNYAFHNASNPPIASSRANATYSYSILTHADLMKNDDNTFEYMIDAVDRGRWGGIWTANDPSYRFEQTTNTATNITLTTQFDNWYYHNSSIEARMPYVSTGSGRLTTSADPSGSWWGTIIESGSSFSPAPWISSGGNSSTQNPGVIWYWLRSR